MWRARPSDLDALHFLRAGALASLAAQALAVLGLALLLLVVTGILSFVAGPAGAVLALSVLLMLLRVLLVLALAGIVASAVAMVVYMLALDALRQLDERTFRTPASLSQVALIGLLLTGVLLVAARPVLVVGSAILLVGYVATMVGVYRAGRRYGSEAMKTGGVVSVFPVLIGPVLVFLGARRAERELSGGEGAVSPSAAGVGQAFLATLPTEPGTVPAGDIAVSCPGCGRDNPVSSKICQGCGRSMGRAASPRSAPQPPLDVG